MSNSGLNWFLTVPPVVHAPFFSLLFWWLTAALGYRMLRLLRVPTVTLTSLEQGFLSLTLGAGFLQYLPWTLGELHLLTVNALRIAMLALTVVLAPDLARVARAAVRAISGWRRQPLSAGAKLWSLLLGLVLVVLLMKALVIGTLGDDDGYHLASPRRWLAAGTLAYLPTYTHTNAAMGFEMLYAIGLAVWDPVGAKILHFGAGLFSLLGIILVARRAGNVLGGLLAISMLMIATPFANMPSLFPLAFADMAAFWMTFASILSWLVWRESQDRRLLICLALCAGFTGSFKFTALSVLVAWLPVLALEAGRKEGWRGGIRTITIFGFVAFAPVLPWLFRNWQTTGNPVYPMFSSIIATRDWSAEQARVFGQYIHYYSWGIASKMTLGRRKLFALIAELIVASLGAVSFYLVRDRALRLLVLFATTFALISLGLTGLYFRYFLPAIACACLVAGVILAQRWLSPYRIWLACALLAAGLIQLLRTAPDLGINTRLALGLTTLEEAYADDAFWNASKYINQQTPKNAHILMASFYSTFGNSSFGGFLLDRSCYATDSHLQTFIDLNTWESFVRSLKAAGITHVMVSDKQFSPGRQGFPFQSASNEYPFSRRLVEDYGQRLAQFGHLQIYEVQPERAEH